jgi:hypothetical protein
MPACDLKHTYPLACTSCTPAPPAPRCCCSPPLPLRSAQSFWTRLSGKYGNKFYWQEKGESAAILNAVSAIDTCLREEPGRSKCAQVQGELGQEPSSGSFGGFFGQ